MKHRYIFFGLVSLILFLLPVDTWATKNVKITAGKGRINGQWVQAYEAGTNIQFENDDGTDRYELIVLIPQGTSIWLDRHSNSGMGTYVKWWSQSYNTTHLNCVVYDTDYGTHSLKGGQDDYAGGFYYNWCYVTTASHTNEEDAYTEELGNIRSKMGANSGDYGVLNLFGLRCSVYCHIYYVRYGFNIQYVANGQTIGSSGEKWRYFSECPFPVPSLTPTCSIPGYTFGGWDSGEERYLKSVTPKSKVTYNNPNCFFVDPNVATPSMYAQWDAIEYSISYDANGGTVSPTPQQSEYTALDTYLLPTPKRPGYTFVSWEVAENSGGWTKGTKITTLPKDQYGTLSLKAIWTETSYTLSADPSNVHVSVPASQTKKYNIESFADMTFTADKNYRITGASITINLDGNDVPGSTYSDLYERSWTFPGATVKGTTTVKVNTSLVSEDVTITRNGLEGQDCSVITVTRSLESSPCYTVILSAEKPSITLSEIPLGTYYIAETDWANTYSRPSSQVIEIKSSDTADTKTITLSGTKTPFPYFSAESHRYDSSK